MTAAVAGRELTREDAAWILARAAELREDPVKNQSYRLTPIGYHAGRYLDELTFANYAAKTVSNREPVLAWLSLDMADRELADVTTADLRDWLARFKDHSPNTKAAYTSYVKVFFAWAHDNDLIPNDPARRLRAPKQEESRRRAHAHSLVRRLLVAQDTRRDRIGILLLYWCALRRNELRNVQFRDIDLANRILTVTHGKGGTVLEQNVPEQVAIELERYILDLTAGQRERWHETHDAYVLEHGDDAREWAIRAADAARASIQDEYLLYPQKFGRLGRWPYYSMDVIWEDRLNPMSTSGLDAWWRRAVKRSGLDHFPMHEMRHTAGTHFHLAGHDLVATSHFMRHRNIATTAKTYVHLDRVRAVAEVQRRMTDPLGGDDA